MGWRRGIFVLVVFVGRASLATLRAQSPGAQIFAANCAGCHGADGRGGEHAPNIATSPEVQHLADSDLASVVKNGISGAGMPAFSSFKPQQIDEVVGFLRVLQGREDMVQLPGSPAQGEALFFGKARCSQCHMVDGKGGFIGSDLSFYGANARPGQLRAVILDPERSLPKDKKATTVVTNTGQKITGMLKVRNNFSLTLQTADGAFHFLPRAELAQVDFGSRSLMPAASSLSGKDVDDLVGYLLRTGKENSKHAAPAKSGDDDN